MKWTADQIATQTGRTVIVTGANAGIGYETALALAKKGARVVLACRSRERGEAAKEKIVAHSGAAEVLLEELDLSELASVRAFAERMAKTHPRIDVLINNAGVMIPPLSKTAEGFELQFGVNYLGHFALTGLLWPLLSQAENARVTTVSSLAHRRGRLDFDNFRGEKRYKGWREYEQSKLACLVFALELDRRIRAKQGRVISNSAHPGLTQTDLQRHNGVMDLGARWFAMKASQGALPSLYAATDPAATGGTYTGPKGIYEARGYPGPAKIMKRANDPEAGKKLWEVSEGATGVSDWV